MGIGRTAWGCSCGCTWAWCKVSTHTAKVAMHWKPSPQRLLLNLMCIVLDEAAVGKTVLFFPFCSRDLFCSYCGGTRLTREALPCTILCAAVGGGPSTLGPGGFVAFATMLV